MQYGNNGNRMGRGMATSQGRGPSPMGMQNAAPQGQMGLQQAQAQALRSPQYGGGMGHDRPVPSLLNPNPGSGGEQMILSGGMPTQPSGTIAPQAPMPQTGVPNQLMGNMNPRMPGPHPVEYPQPTMPMGGQNRPEMMMPQRNSFAGGAGMGQRPYGGNRGYGRR